MPKTSYCLCYRSQTDSLADTCNAGCSCTTEFYDPVCDEQGTKYFSSCHAGCAEISEDGKVSHVIIFYAVIPNYKGNSHV